MSGTQVVVSSEQLLLDQRRFWRTRLSWMVLIGFALRLGFVLFAHTYRFKSVEGNFGFAYEMGRIAAALASGEGFSNPFKIPTGPTAWEPPLYPFIIAGVFKLTGIYTTTSSIILLAINSLFSALTAVPVFYLAKRAFGIKIATWSAWTWTLLPSAMYWSVKWIWETSMAQFLLVTLLLLAWRLAEGARWREWALWGLLWSFTALLNPSLLSVLPFLAGWIVFQRRRELPSVVAPAALAAAVFILLITPWLVRNSKVFHQAVFIRTNFGAELRFGNGPGANGLSMGFLLHPTHSPEQLSRYKQLGELAYVSEMKRQAVQWICANPAAFLRASFVRFVYYWTSTPWGSRMMPAKNALFLASSICGFWGLWLMWKQRRPGFFLFAICLFVFPLVYYIVFPHPRYRAPIEPELFTLMIFLLSQSRELQSHQ